MKLVYSLRTLVVVELVTLIAFYAPFIFEGASFYFADATFWLQPMAQYISDSIHQGRIPLWNPLSYCGMPQLAITFPNLLYPPDALFFLFPFSTALALSMVLHQTLAAVGMYLLVRSMREPEPSAMSAALIYSLSGYMFALSSNHSLVAGSAWFVVAFWSLRQLEFVAAARLPMQTFFGAASFYMLFASGRPEIFVPSYLIMAAYVVRNFARRKPNENNCLYWQMRVLFLGVCFALPTLLPTFEWLPLSRRALGLQTFEVFLYSAGWYDILSMITGQALGDLRMYGAQFKPLLSPLNMPPYLSCAFVGAVAATLAIWGIATRAWRIKWILVFTLAATLLFSMGNNIPGMSRLVETIPVLGFIRFPVKVLFVALFTLSLLAARGMTVLLELRAAVRLSVWVWVLTLFFAMVWIFAASAGTEVAHFGGFGRTAHDALEAQRQIGFALCIAAAFGIVSTGIGFLASRNSYVQKLRAPAMVSLLFATLVAHAALFERVGAGPDYFQQPSLASEQIQKIQESGINANSRVLNLCLERLTVPDYYLRGTQKDRSIAFYQYDREILIPNTNMNFGLASSHGFEGTMRGDYFHTLLYAYFQSTQTLNPSVSPQSDSALACFSKITNTGFIVTQVERKLKTGEIASIRLLDDRYFHLLFEDRVRNIRIFQVKDVLPRAYLARDWKTVTHNEAIEGVLAPESNKFNPEKVSWLEGGEASLDKVRSSDESRSNSSVELLEPSPERLVVNCTTDGPSILVVADQPYPGWVSTIDGSPTSIFTANAFNRAVFVPPGQHKVCFEYYPNSFVLGTSLAGLSLLLLLYLFWKHKGGS